MDIGDTVRIITPYGLTSNGKPIVGRLAKIISIDGANISVKCKHLKHEMCFYDNELALPDESWWGENLSELDLVKQHINNNIRTSGSSRWNIVNGEVVKERTSKYIETKIEKSNRLETKLEEYIQRRKDINKSIKSIRNEIAEL